MRVVIHYGDGEGVHADMLHTWLREWADWGDPQPFAVCTEYDAEENP